jgi:hypothetical protein
MSEDKFEQDEPKDEDVEAHHKRKANDDLALDDVEAHSHKRKANDEPGSDESDDVEAHVKRR